MIFLYLNIFFSKYCFLRRWSMFDKKPTSSRTGRVHQKPQKSNSKLQYWSLKNHSSSWQGSNLSSKSLNFEVFQYFDLLEWLLYASLFLYGIWSEKWIRARNMERLLSPRKRAKIASKLPPNAPQKMIWRWNDRSSKGMWMNPWV